MSFDPKYEAFFRSLMLSGTKAPESFGGNAANPLEQPTLGDVEYFDRSAYGDELAAKEQEAIYRTIEEAQADVNNYADARITRNQIHTMARLDRDFRAQRMTRIQATVNEASRRFRMGQPTGSIANEWLTPIKNLEKSKPQGMSSNG